MLRFWCAFLALCFLATSTDCKTVTHKEKDKHKVFVDDVKDRHHHGGEHNTDFDRDILLGDEGDDDIDGLSEQEKKEKLTSLVQKRIDADKDGFVSMQELVDWTRRSLDMFETEETREQFPEVDANKDGSIQWKEYSDETYGADFSEDSDDFKSPPSDEWKDFVNEYKRDKAKFEASDLDKSGDLNMDEFIIFKHPRRHENTRNIVIEEALESSDLNDDGAIDVKEFLGEYQKAADDGDPEWAIFEKDKFANELDTNKDGVLTGEEILLWIAPDNDILAHEEAEHLMEESDADEDDRLSLKEILDNLADWMESETTDYGQQLLADHDEL